MTPDHILAHVLHMYYDPRPTLNRSLHMTNGIRTSRAIPEAQQVLHDLKRCLHEMHIIAPYIK